MKMTNNYNCFVVRVFPERVRNPKSWVHDRSIFPRKSPAAPFEMLAHRRLHDSKPLYIYDGLTPFGWVYVDQAEIVDMCYLTSFNSMMSVLSNAAAIRYPAAACSAGDLYSS